MLPECAKAELECFAEVLAHFQRAGNAVFMEAVPPVSTGVIGTIDAVYFPVAVSGSQARRIISRMMINHLPVYFGRIDGFRQIQ